MRERIERATRWLAAAFFVSLPFHRPPLVTLGPALTLPEVVFVPLAVVLGAAYLQKQTPVPRVGLRMALGVFVGFLPSIPLAENRTRAAAQLLVLLYIVAIFTAAVTIRNLGHAVIAARAAVSGAALACAIGLAALAAFSLGVPAEWGPGELLGWYPWMSLARPVGPTESPTMLALVALSGLVAVTNADLSRRASLAFVTLFIATIVASQSRVLLLLLAGVAVLVYATSKQKIRRVGGALAFAAVTVLVALSILVRVVPVRREPPFIDQTISPYRVCSEIALAMFREHPLTGVGLENFQNSWARHYVPSRHDAAFSGGAEHVIGTPLDPHSTIPGYLAEGGIIGIAGLAWMIREVARSRRRDTAYAVAYLAALGLALAFVDLLTERSTAAMLGLVVVTTRKKEGE